MIVKLVQQLGTTRKAEWALPQDAQDIGEHHLNKHSHELEIPQSLRALSWHMISCMFVEVQDLPWEKCNYIYLIAKILNSWKFIQEI